VDLALVVATEGVDEDEDVAGAPLPVSCVVVRPIVADGTDGNF
jgi:hypothetical protein